MSTYEKGRPELCGANKEPAQFAAPFPTRLTSSEPEELSPLQIWKAGPWVLLNLHPSGNSIKCSSANIRRKVVNCLLLASVLESYGLGVEIIGPTALLRDVTVGHTFG